MKLLALGGCGAMGQHAVNVAFEDPIFTEIIIADRDLDSARAFARRFPTKVRAIGIDVTDRPALLASMAEADVAISTVGPYYRFGTMVLSAAIEAGCHYVDICDDWEPTLDMLKLDAAASEAGVSAVVGAGASPGISNLLALTAHSALDSVHTLHTVWGAGQNQDDDEDDPTSVATMEHWVQQISGTIEVFSGGQRTLQNPLREVSINYPGIGEVVCHTCGHPEPLTLPLYLPGLSESLNLMDMPSFVISALKQTAKRVNAGEMSVRQGAEALVELWEGDSLSSLWEGIRIVGHSVGEALTGRQYLPESAGVAIGTLGGKPATATASLDGSIKGGMGPMTCYPTAIVARMIGLGEVTRRGVFAPEAGVAPERFFHHLQALAHRPKGAAERPFVNLTVKN